MMIEAEPLWGKDVGGLVYISTEGEVFQNGPLWQMEPLSVEEAFEFAACVIKAAQQALNWELTDGGMRGSVEIPELSFVRNAQGVLSANYRKKKIQWDNGMYHYITDDFAISSKDLHKVMRAVDEQLDKGES